MQQYVADVVLDFLQSQRCACDCVLQLDHLDAFFPGAGPSSSAAAAAAARQTADMVAEFERHQQVSAAEPTAVTAYAQQSQGLTSSTRHSPASSSVTQRQFTPCASEPQQPSVCWLEVTAERCTAGAQYSLH